MKIYFSKEVYLQILGRKLVHLNPQFGHGEIRHPPFWPTTSELVEESLDDVSLLEEFEPFLQPYDGGEAVSLLETPTSGSSGKSKGKKGQQEKNTRSTKKCEGHVKRVCVSDLTTLGN